MRYFGLIGERLDYSFSKDYFAKKFEKEGIDNCHYDSYEIESIEMFPDLIKSKRFSGLNVTIPYKEKVIPYLDELDEAAKEIGAVNTITFDGSQLKGYNTDILGFESSLLTLLGSRTIEKALVLGTGGASKAIQYVLKKLGIKVMVVSRKNGDIQYDKLDKDIIKTSKLIVNCTPLGTYPKINECPSIAYEHLDKEHLLYDLVYNPEKSLFLNQGEKRGCKTMNGLPMLIGQAETAWKIWNKQKVKMEIEPGSDLQLDFNNTKIAFSPKGDKQLKKMFRLFKLMNKKALVNASSKLGLLAVKLNLPFSKTIIRNTIFEQFVGGENLLDCQQSITELYKADVLTILDYGAEGKSEEEDLNHTANEFFKAVEFAAANESVPCVVAKITGLVANEILEKLDAKEPLNESEKHQYDKLVERLHNICKRADQLKVGLFLDAEESWIQDTIDHLAEEMMETYNKDYIVVYNTFQLYRSDKLQYLKDSHQRALDGGYILGAKLVRGAYMEKERRRAEEMNYPSPINPTKQATDDMYDEAVQYCVKNYETIASCVASHNEKSIRLQAELMDDMGIDKSHPHLNFCQLYGMSDHFSFNLAASGFNAAKYVPYGSIKDVVPYLIRRAQENSSVSGEMGRELKIIKKEIQRRGL